MHKIEVRAEKEADISSIQDLAHDFFKREVGRDSILNVNWPYLPEGKQHFQSMIIGKACICLVAVVDGKLMGYLTGKVVQPNAKRPEKRTELENIFVEEAYRDQHVGTLLAHAFLK